MLVIKNSPAAFIPKLKALIISDLHLGLEYELFRKGITIQPQAEIFAKDIKKLIKITKAKRLIILGDLKHEVPGLSKREEIKIPELLNEIKSLVKIDVVKGNHDTFLEEILPEKIKLHSSKGFKIKEYGFFHGHAWPSKNLMKCDKLFMGHLHPVVEFRDSLGYRAIEKVWIKGRLNQKLVKNRYKIKKTGKLEIMIFPAFNPLLGGIVVNSTLKEGLIGPLISKKFLDIKNSKVYLLDGTFLGKVSWIT